MSASSQNEGKTPGPIDMPAPQSPSPSARKPLGFYLAFVGLALTVFVFQMDVTALGIAIPVGIWARRGNYHSHFAISQSPKSSMEPR